jgi:hypothetical protein
MAKLKIKRGTDAERLPVVFEVGEPVWTTDTKKLYVGDGQTPGGIQAGLLTTLISWKGDWDSSFQYTEHSAVYYNGGSWLALIPSLNVQPVEGEYWTQIARRGDQGIQGPKGDAGLGFAIKKTYTTVASLLADTNPTGIVNGEFAIVNTIDPNDEENSRLYLWNNGWTYVSDLSGAQGIKGDKGDKGLQYQGAWLNTTSYVVDDVVVYNGSSFICIQANTNQTPQSGNYWSLVASKGDKGNVGAQFRGVYSSNTTYVVNDIVTYNGSSYIALKETLNVEPAENSDWSVLAKQGNAGLSHKGQWVPATTYVTGDSVTFNGSSYICIQDNTSATIDSTTSIPAMTSNTTPSGTVDASSSYDSNHLPFYAVDNSNTTFWNSTLSSPPHSWQYTFTSVKVIARYSIDVQTHTSQGPKSWLFQGLSGANWVTIETRTNVTNWASNPKQTFDIASPQGYTSFRFLFNDSNSSNGDIAIHNIEMFNMPGANVPTNPAVWSLLASKGDTGLGFSIKKIYLSVASLLADTNPSNIGIDEHAIIQSNTEDPDNAKLYRWSGTNWIYLADLSGVSTHSELSNLQGGQAGERYHLTQVQHDSLVSGESTSIHFHDLDRDRANHTGTQLSTTISDFTEAVQSIPTDGGYF